MNWKNKYKKKDTKCKLKNNVINWKDARIIIGTFLASVTLSITGVGIIVVAIAAGVGCAAGILIKICSSYWKKKYANIQKTLDDFRQLHVTSLKDNHIDEKEYHRLVNMYENYRTASRAASCTASQIRVTNKPNQ